MALIEPSKGEAEISDLGSELRIVVPQRPRGFGGWSGVIFTTGWLIGWSVGEVVVGAMLLRYFGLVRNVPAFEGMDTFPAFAIVFMLGWFIAWTAGGAVAWTAWLRMLIGREIIAVTSGVLAVQVLPLGRKREYRLNEVAALRAPEDNNPYAGRNTGWGVGQNGLAFDYGAKTVRFGSNLDTAEARQIVELILSRFGNYMKQNG